MLKTLKQSKHDYLNLYNYMPWYKFIDNDLDICDPDSYEMLEKAPDCVDGCYLYAIFADPIPDDPLQRPDIDSTPGLLFYIIRALAKGKGQPVSLSPPVPLEVRMSPVPTRAESTKNLPADYGTLDPLTEQK